MLPKLLFYSVSLGCPNSITPNKQVLPMVGELKNVRLATEVHYLFKDEKLILEFKRVPSARTKADSDMQSAASTFGLTIGNTLVGGSKSTPPFKFLYRNSKKTKCHNYSRQLIYENNVQTIFVKYKIDILFTDIFHIVN